MSGHAVVALLTFLSLPLEFRELRQGECLGSAEPLKGVCVAPGLRTYLSCLEGTGRFTTESTDSRLTLKGRSFSVPIDRDFDTARETIERAATTKAEKEALRKCASIAAQRNDLDRLARWQDRSRAEAEERFVRAMEERDRLGARLSAPKLDLPRLLKLGRGASDDRHLDGVPDVRDPTTDLPVSPQRKLMDAISSEWDRLPIANGSLKVPQQMELGQDDYEMGLAISVRKSLQELHGQLDDMVKNGSFHDQRGFKVAEYISAVVADSDAFAIKIVGAQETTLADGDASWRWRVRPLLEGDHPIDVSLNVRFKDEGSWKTVKTYSEHVTIHAIPQGFWRRVAGFVTHNWKWLWTAIAVPLVGVLLRVAKRWRDKKRGNPELAQPF